MTMVFCIVVGDAGELRRLMAPYLQNLAGYPVETAGWSMAPRGIGTMAACSVAAPAVACWSTSAR